MELLTKVLFRVIRPESLIILGVVVIGIIQHDLGQIAVAGLLGYLNNNGKGNES